MSDDKMAQNAGKSFTDTPGVAGKDGGKGGGSGLSEGGKTPSPDLTDEERAAMKRKAMEAGDSKG